MHPTRLRRGAALGATSLVATALLVLAGQGTALAAPGGTDGTAAPRATAAVDGPARNPLLKQRLAEEREGGAQLDPPGAPGALCQSFIGKPNPYRNPAPNVDQIVDDAIVQAGTQQGCSSAQNETSIAVNPYNPRNIVAGANDYRVFNSRENRNDASGWAYTSFDGGRTWKNVQLPGLTFQTGGTGAFSWFDSAGDPVLGFGPGNTVYYGNIVFSRTVSPGGSQTASAIVVNVSHDGGLHWGAASVLQIDGVDAAGHPTPTDFFNDKLWLAADRFSGRVYVTWTRFSYDPAGTYLESPIVLSASTDFGRTWSGQRRISPPQAGFAGGEAPFAQGSNPQVGRDGTVYVAYESSVCATLACTSAGDRDATIVATSTDRGRTFSRTVVDTDYDFPATLTGENFRLNSFPQLGYDPVADRLYVTWADDRNGTYDATGASVQTNGDVIVATSRGGRTWSAPTVIGSPQDEFFPAVATFAGFVAVTSYTRAYDPAGRNLDYGYWKSFGPSRLAGAPLRRISTQSSDPRIQFTAVGEDGELRQGVFIGDYSAVAIGADLRIHPCWTDFRGRPGVTAPNQDAYTQSISLL